MNGRVFEAPAENDAFVRECRTGLLSRRPARFDYPKLSRADDWPVEEIGNLYANFRDRRLGTGNVYAIWTRGPSEGESWRPRYVGERRSEYLAARIREHLVKKGKGAGSKLDDVQRAVFDGSEIAVSCIMVRPEELRYYVEAAILNLESRLDWNGKGTIRAAAGEETSGGAHPEPGPAFAPAAAPSGMSMEETIAALRRERAGRPPVSAAEIRAARDRGRP